MKEADMKYDGFGGMDEAGQNESESVHEAEEKRDRIQSTVGAEANGIGNTIGMEIAGIGSAASMGFGGVAGVNGMTGEETFWGLPVAFAMEEEARDRIGMTDEQREVLRQKSTGLTDDSQIEELVRMVAEGKFE